MVAQTEEGAQTAETPCTETSNLATKTESRQKPHHGMSDHGLLGGTAPNKEDGFRHVLHANGPIVVEKSCHDEGDHNGTVSTRLVAPPRTG